MKLEFANTTVECPDDTEFVSLWAGMFFKRRKPGSIELLHCVRNDHRWRRCGIRYTDLPWLDTLVVETCEMMPKPIGKK